MDDPSPLSRHPPALYQPKHCVVHARDHPEARINMYIFFSFEPACSAARRMHRTRLPKHSGQSWFDLCKKANDRSVHWLQFSHEPVNSEEQWDIGNWQSDGWQDDEHWNESGGNCVQPDWRESGGDAAEKSILGTDGCAHQTVIISANERDTLLSWAMKMTATAS